jgi:hypothetical protein
LKGTPPPTHPRCRCAPQVLIHMQYPKAAVEGEEDANLIRNGFALAAHAALSAAMEVAQLPGSVPRLGYCLLSCMAHCFSEEDYTWNRPMVIDQAGGQHSVAQVFQLWLQGATVGVLDGYVKRFWPPAHTSGLKYKIPAVLHYTCAKRCC